MATLAVRDPRPDHRFVTTRLAVVVATLFAMAGCGSKNHELRAIGAPVGPTTGKLHLTIGFSKPMVARDKLDKVLTVAPYFATPAIQGDAKWLDERTLVVWPTAPLPVSTKFVVTVPRETKALDGNELDEALTYEFSTERLSATLDVLGTADHASQDQTVRLSFNQSCRSRT